MPASTQASSKKAAISTTPHEESSKKVQFYSYTVSNIYRVRANQYIPVADISAGDIVAISGLKETRAGETLTETGDSQFVLDKLELPSAIFTMPI